MPRLSLLAVLALLACEQAEPSSDAPIDDTAEDSTPPGEEDTESCAPELWYADLDGDGVGAGEPAESCEPMAGFSLAAGDCNDQDATIHPGAGEVCDGIDNDCDGAVDVASEDGSPPEGARDWHEDADGDGYGAEGGITACVAPEGYTAQGGDCDDTDSGAHPGAAELCGGPDRDCDGVASGDGVSWQTEGGWSDRTAAFASGTDASPHVEALSSPGTLHLCEGAWFAQLALYAEVDVVGAGRDLTMLDAAEAGPVVLVGPGAVASLDGVTLMGGSASSGGGLSATEATVSISDSRFLGNVAQSSGGGAYLYQMVGVELSGVLFEDNHATSGGGLAVEESDDAVLRDLHFEDNTSGEHGGGLYVYFSDRLDLETAAFERNTSGGAGGGMTLRKSLDGVATDLAFTENASTYDGGGGLIVASSDRALVQGASFERNTASWGGGTYVYNSPDSVLDEIDYQSNESHSAYWGGGGLYTNSADDLTVSDTTFSDNTASRYGGGVYLYYTPGVHFEDVVFDSNVGATGGALRLTVSDATGDNVDFVDNEPSDISVSSNAYGMGLGADFDCSSYACTD